MDSFPDVLKSLILSYCLDHCPQTVSFSKSVKEQAYSWRTGIPKSQIEADDVDNFITLSSLMDTDHTAYKFLTRNNMKFFPPDMNYNTTYEMLTRSINPATRKAEHASDHNINAVLTVLPPPVVHLAAAMSCCISHCGKNCPLMKAMYKRRLENHMNRYLREYITYDKFSTKSAKYKKILEAII